ncbi:hypothetical protein LEMLEM_LOCUS10032 [Lemmus lemmus]
MVKLQGLLWNRLFPIQARLLRVQSSASGTTSSWTSVSLAGQRAWSTGMQQKICFEETVPRIWVPPDVSVSQRTCLLRL